MQRLITLLLSLMVALSFGTTSLAHAMEPIGCIDAQEASLLGHAATDTDQVSADGDKGYPHHHGGCPGHVVGVPVGDRDLRPVTSPTSPLLPTPSPALAAIKPDALHRPPRA